MNNLINKAQNAFVGGRQILVASFIANELFFWISKLDNIRGYRLHSEEEGKGNFVQVRHRKTCDRINWKFLFGVLQPTEDGLQA